MVNPAKEKEYIRLYNLAVDAVSDGALLEARSDDDIKELISPAGWLGLRERGSSKEEFTNSPKPNVWIDINEIEKDKRYPDALDEDITEPGVRIGLYFNTIDAMRNAKNLLESHNEAQKEDLLAVLSHLDDVYQTRLRRKIKPYNYAQTPDYVTVMKFKTNQIDDKKIAELFEKSGQIEAEGKLKMETGQVVQEFPSLDLLYLNLKRDDAEFTRRIKEVFEVYRIVRTIKSKKAVDREEALKKQKADEIVQKEFRDFLEDLKKLNLPPEQHRERVSEWWRSHKN